MAEKGLSGARITKLGRYEVLSELGKGAMGVVYLAKDPVIGRLVAIKTIRTASLGDDDSEVREFKERFVREAQTAGILNHPNIVTIHDIGEDVDMRTSFIAMEYIEGKNLKSMLGEKNKFTYDQIADTIAQVAEALDYAHRKGIIHRDVKPANIIITTDGKVKITDFGIAKIASSNLTSTGQFLGTPNYMSPEQVSGAPVDGRSDIFSLGVVLYELLTNRKPFLGDNLTAISYKIVHEDFTPPAELLAEVPSDFNAIVARAMAKDPWNRYQRGKDFALALHQLRAHLEEQKALQDLGSMVSAAENMPTLRLENLSRFLPGAEPEATLVPPPSDNVVTTRMTDLEALAAAGAPKAAASAAVTPAADIAATRAIVLPTDIPPPPEELEPVRSAESTNPTAGVEATRATGTGRSTGTSTSPSATSSTGSPVVDVPTEYLPALPPPLPPPPLPLPTSRPDRLTRSQMPGRSAASLRATQALEKARVWFQLLKAEINTRWFYIVAGSALSLVLLVCGLIFIRSLVVAKPTVVNDAALAQDTEDRKKELEEGKKLFNAGRYEESLATFRRVLARSPNNLRARQYAQMSENALQGRVEEARKSTEADRLIEAGQAAFGAGKFGEARKKAEEALALDGGKIDAQRLKEDASAKLAEAEAAAEARKKRAREAQAKKAPAQTEQVTVRRPAPAQSTAQAPAAAPARATTATLNLVFDSPISEGNVMVAVNDQIRLKLPFSFKRKVSIFKTVKETGTVTGTIAVDPGSIALKVWLSGPDIATAYKNLTTSVSAGETRTVRLEYTGGQLNVRFQ